METLQARLTQHRQRSTPKQPATEQPTTNRTTEPQPKPNKSRESRLRHLLAVLDFLAATEPFFARELAACASAIRIKVTRTAEGDLQTVLKALAEGGMTIDDLSEETGLSYHSVYALVRRLEVAGLVGQTRLNTRDERLGKPGGCSKRLVWFLCEQNPQAGKRRTRYRQKQPELKTP